MGETAIGFQDILDAAQRLRGVAHRTPVVTSASLDELAGNRLYLKCENFQRVGAFKFRGAYNAIAKLTPEERKRGVVAFSSGNHAQGVALAARLLEVPATIVMPRDASPIKLAATRGYGADVIEYDPATQVREDIANRIQAEHDAVLIPPFDHPDVIAGQGTAALELLEDIPDLDAIVTPAGGGGLLSGSAIAARALSPAIEMIGVEPAAGDDWAKSWERGERVTIPPPQTIAEGLKLTRPGEITWPIVRRLVSRFVTVTDEEIADAVGVLVERVKIVVEAAGAVPVAASIRRKVGLRGKKIGLLISGGNIDARALGILDELRRGAIAKA